MLGAIIGDIAGSTYEVDEIKAYKNKVKIPYEERIKILDQNTPIFKDESTVTDDSILTMAIAKAAITDRNYEEMLRYYGKLELMREKDKWGRSRFGRGFIEWLNKNEIGTSYGNGSAMRISPVAYISNSLEELLEETMKATIPSHNNEEAILGAKAVSVAIFLARTNHSKEEIKKYIETEIGYNLDFDLEQLQRNYTFKVNCNDSVPQAIYVFLESNDFEDGIRKAISIGGDSDTIAAITGSICEAYYGIPEHLKIETLRYLEPYMIDIIDEFYEKVKEDKVLIKGKCGKYEKR